MYNHLTIYGIDRIIQRPRIELYRFTRLSKIDATKATKHTDMEMGRELQMRRIDENDVFRIGYVMSLI